MHAPAMLQDTPGIYEEGVVVEAVAKFIKEGNEEYMEFEQVMIIKHSPRAHLQ